MKILGIKIINDYILGNLELDFRDSSGKAIETIILAGENGVGKTRILEIIHNFFYGSIVRNESFQMGIFEIEIELSQKENEIMKKYIMKHHTASRIRFYNLRFTYIMVLGPDKVNKIRYYEENGRMIEYPLLYHMLNQNELHECFQCSYSTTHVNFDVEKLKSVTAKNLDEEIHKSNIQNLKTATEISQLLIDIYAQDNDEIASWVRENPDVAPPREILNKRMSRFTKAFDYMFPKKKFKEIKNENGYKEIKFEENGKEMSIDSLSSGEKQIVFRGGFLLKNKGLNRGVVLIDEPEISLHPTWQIKIVEFYKTMCQNDDEGNQLIITTHSPFILHNNNRREDKVIILKKNEFGQIMVENEGKYPNWTNEEIVKEAFNVAPLIEKIKDGNKNTLIITEGKTDWKHYKAALKHFKANGKFASLDIAFLEYDDSINMSDSELENFLKCRAKVFEERKVIGIFDSDTQIGKRNRNRDYTNNSYGICIETPEHRKLQEGICVEFLYKDEDLLKEDDKGRRLYLSSEFQKNGRLKMNTDISYENSIAIRSNLEINKQKIIDNGVSNGKEESLALSKEAFAKSVYEGTPPYSEMDFSSFESLFEAIEEIVNK